jgi:DNA repair protein RadC
MRKITFKERRFTTPSTDWVVPPNCNIKVIYKTIPRAERVIIRNSEAAVSHLKPSWPDIDHYETSMIVYLNQANVVIGVQRVATGGITGVVMDTRIILQTALLLNACKLVICHNHPSGSIKPSQADENITQKIKAAAAFHEITVQDHIILTNDSYYSFADEGIL